MLRLNESDEAVKAPEDPIEAMKKAEKQHELMKDEGDNKS
jgi:hypothetical protein